MPFNSFLKYLVFSHSLFTCPVLFKHLNCSQLSCRNCWWMWTRSNQFEIYYTQNLQDLTPCNKATNNTIGFTKRTHFQHLFSFNAKMSTIPRPSGPITPSPWASSHRSRSIFLAKFYISSLVQYLHPYWTAIWNNQNPIVFLVTRLKNFSTHLISMLIYARLLLLVLLPQ